MKIDGFGSISSSNNVPKRKGISGAGSFSDLLAAAESEESSATNAASDIAAPAPLNNLLALQEMPEELLQRKKLVQQGNTMLDTLENLRRQLLTGALSIATLSNINKQIVLKKQVVNDPQLNAIIDDIEMRVAIELAKLEYAVDHSNN